MATERGGGGGGGVPVNRVTLALNCCVCCCSQGRGVEWRNKARKVSGVSKQPVSTGISKSKAGEGVLSRVLRKLSVGSAQARELSQKIHAHFPNVPMSRLRDPRALICNSCYQVIFKDLQLVRPSETSTKGVVGEKVSSQGCPAKGVTTTLQPQQKRSKPGELPGKDVTFQTHYETRSRRRGAISRLAKEIIKAELENVDCPSESSKETGIESSRKTRKKLECGRASLKIGRGLEKEATEVRRSSRTMRSAAQNPKTKVKSISGKAKKARKAKEQRLKGKITSLAENGAFFCCPKCCSRFSKDNMSTFVSHIREVCSVKKQFPCELCGHLFTRKSVLSCHIEFSHDKPNPQSKLIRVKPRNEYVSDMIRIYENRCKTQNHDSRDETDDEMNNSGPSEQQQSNDATSSPRSFEKVLKKITAELESSSWPEDQKTAEALGVSSGTWKCWICFYESHKKSFWLTHMNRIHPGAKGKFLTCQYCKVKVIFIKKHHLREHLHEVHYDLISRTCESCGQTFLHKNSQHSCSKILCNVCGESFVSKTEMSKHLLSHSEYRPYTCEICDKGFQKKWYLSIHLRSHYDTRPYQCDICGNSFRSKSHYNNHRRIHTGEKPYVCHTCGKSFSSPQRLHHHLQSAHEVRQFSCETCAKKFITAYDLRQHKLIHTDLKPFHCKICDKAFNRKGNCLAHERNHEKKRKAGDYIKSVGETAREGNASATNNALEITIIE